MESCQYDNSSGDVAEDETIMVDLDAHRAGSLVHMASYIQKGYYCGRCCHMGWFLQACYLERDMSKPNYEFVQPHLNLASFTNYKYLHVFEKHDGFSSHKAPTMVIDFVSENEDPYRCISKD